MPLTADSNGVVVGKFTIPANIHSGTKRVAFEGQGGSKGEGVFVGQGILTTDVREMITKISEYHFSPGLDPLAQTFSLADLTPVGGVDLWFAAKGTSDVLVQIRGVELGFPNEIVYAQGRVKPADISLTTNTRIAFAAPVYLQPNTEYAIVVLCNDSVARLSLAQLGKFDASVQKFVTQQAYNVGVLLSSSNNSSWTVHQDKDLAFRLLQAVFSATERTIDLGTVAVTGATDLMLLALSNAPTFDSRIEYTLTLPDASTLRVTDGLPVRLAAAITGNVGISAKLIGTAAAAPTLFPGVQLISGAVDATGTYITVATPAGADSRIRVVFDAVIPSGAAVLVEVSGIDIGDTYAAVPFVSSLQLTSDKYELTHEILHVTENYVRVRLTCSGTTGARPLVENLRVIVM